jgi:type VI secretion system protein ImpF
MNNNRYYNYISVIDRLLEGQWDQSGLALYGKPGKYEHINSILKNLSNILNTRSQTPADIYDKSELTVLDFGIPDFGHYSPENFDDIALMAKRLKKAVEAFEPRLTNVSIDFKKEMPDEKSLTFGINAVIRNNIYSYEISFLSKKQYTEGNWAVYETMG